MYLYSTFGNTRCFKAAQCKYTKCMDKVKYIYCIYPTLYKELGDIVTFCSEIKKIR